MCLDGYALRSEDALIHQFPVTFQGAVCRRATERSSRPWSAEVLDISQKALDGTIMERLAMGQGVAPER